MPGRSGAMQCAVLQKRQHTGSSLLGQSHRHTCTLASSTDVVMGVTDR